MSFGIYLNRQISHGSAEADREGVRAALSRWGWDGSPGSPYQIGTDDGVTVEFYASGLDDPSKPFLGGNLEVHGFSTELCGLVLDLARAGSFIVRHDGDASAVILVSEDQRADLPADLADQPELIVCSTPQALAAVLDSEFEKWWMVRDRACGRSPE
jgi:hypothetical protein